jgi:hypothetical protein
LFWFALVGWVVFVLGPLLLLYSPTVFFGLFSLIGLNWVPVLIVAANLPVWIMGMALSIEYGVLLLTGGLGVFRISKGKVVEGSRILLGTGIASLAAYPGPSIGPALMVAAGAGGIYAGVRLEETGERLTFAQGMSAATMGTMRANNAHHAREPEDDTKVGERRKPACLTDEFIEPFTGSG